MRSPTTAQAAPYETEAAKFLNSFPGKARSIFVSWETIASFYNFDYESELENLNIDENYMINQAFNKTRQYVDGLEDEFQEEEILEIENKYLQAVKKHWSLANIIISHLNIKYITDCLNQWSKTGPHKLEIFAVPPKKGFSISYFPNASGISFTIYDTFIIPYTELYYEEHNNLPEWNLEDLKSEDIIETCFLLEKVKGNVSMIDLTDWADWI